MVRKFRTKSGLSTQRKWGFAKALKGRCMYKHPLLGTTMKAFIILQWHKKESIALGSSSQNTVA